MSEAELEDFELPPIDQVAYVVKDLDRAIERFGALFGPFSVIDGEVVDALYRGRSADAKLRVAFGRSGPLEIELIEVVSGESPHREFLEAYGEGVHHIRCPVEDLDRALVDVNARGFETIWYKANEEQGVKFAYVQASPGQGGAMIELIEGLPSGPTQWPPK